MEALRKIVKTNDSTLTVVDLPEAYRNKEVEVIILEVEQKSGNKKYNMDAFANKTGIVCEDPVEYQRKLRDEWK